MDVLPTFLWKEMKIIAKVVFLFILQSPTVDARHISSPWDGLRTLLAGNRRTTLSGSENQRQDMLIIGAGFGRTGTTSFVEALKQLGLKPYHMIEGLLETPGHIELWKDFLDSRNATAVIDQIAQDGFNATSDFPICMLYEPLMERYPRAKVVLTVRTGNNPGLSFAKSTLSTIFQPLPLFTRPPFVWLPQPQLLLRIFKDWIFEVMDAPCSFTEEKGLVLPSRESLAKSYDDWVTHVVATIPPERLLVFSPLDGYGPLCEFLSPLHPDIQERCEHLKTKPYPKLNDSKRMRVALSALSIICDITAALPFASVGLAVAFAGSLMIRKTRGKKKSNKKNE